jgi:hypothetical protein
MVMFVCVVAASFVGVGRQITFVSGDQTEHCSDDDWGKGFKIYIAI